MTVMKTSPTRAALLLFAIIALGTMSCRSTNPIARAQLIQCIKIAERIETAKHSIAMGRSLPRDATLTQQQIEELGEYMIGGWAANKCPCGGTYKVGKLNEKPSCSVHGKVYYMSSRY